MHDACHVWRVGRSIAAVMGLLAVISPSGCVEISPFTPGQAVSDDGTPDASDGGDQETDAGCVDPCAGEQIPPCWEGVPQDDCSCELQPKPGLSPCDDGNACTFDDRCREGNCQGVAAGVGAYCDDDNECTFDSCDPATGCLNEPQAGSCDDGDPCTGGEKCTNGVCGDAPQYTCGVCDEAADDCETVWGDDDPCNGTLVCTDGFCHLDPETVITCDDDPTSPCETAQCDPEQAACVTVPKDDGTLCNDGNPCSTGDICTDGVCAGEVTSADICSCTVDADCAKLDDQDLCNGTMACVGGVCLLDLASIVKCPKLPAGGCLSLACDPDDGDCKAVFFDTGVTCQDGDPCTVDDACDGSGSCGGSPLDCSGVDTECGTGKCEDGTCVLVPGSDGVSCDAGDPCVSTAECTGGDCLATAFTTCDDGDPCTVDVCAAGAGCVFQGPPEPDCGSDGVCAAGVPLACVAGSYECDFDALADYGTVELCDSLDNDCDGQTDENCVGETGCAAGDPVSSYADDTMQACSSPDGVGASDDKCAGGWHLCSYDEFVAALGDSTPPADYWLAAKLVFAEGAATIEGNDGVDCVPFDGTCGGARSVQAKTSGGMTAGVAYVAEAWGCSAGTPTADCGTVSLAGAMCCQNTCGADQDCDDGDDCTEDVCDPVSGSCANIAPPDPGCPTQGVCAGGVPLSCQGSNVSCDTSAVAGFEATEASCDGLDNDCDGKTDASDADLAAVTPPLCANQQGVCAGATGGPARCQGGKWQACSATAYIANSGDYDPVEEMTCDGLDNDCDGQTDEVFAWQGQVVGSACDGIGACGTGVVVCRPDGLGATCSTNPDGTDSDATPEICNGLDDDCNGLIDDDPDPTVAGCPDTGVCGGGRVQPVCLGAGGWDCDTTAALGYEPDEVTCDGLDNDCDGQTDEGFQWDPSGVDPPLAVGSSCGVSGCDNGVVVCNGAGDGAVCQDAEVCDGVDNDCNGQTDEGLTWQGSAIGEACDGSGSCGAGVVECGANLAVTCSTNPNGSNPQGVPETCNGQDDDCDGTIDDGQLYQGIALGQPCEGLGQCGAGTVECGSNQKATCSTNPAGTASQAVPEVCNGLDDDCDGFTDEGLTVADSDCLLAGVCTVSNVSATCQGAAGWTCDYSGVTGYQAGNETGLCDGKDNDCDGMFDEDFPLVGQPCDSAQDEDLCANGYFGCGADLVSVVCEDDSPTFEVCGGGDEDCDGQTDEADAEGCVPHWLDTDGDGYGVGEPQCLCEPDLVNQISATQAGDCDDGAPGRNPGAPELCDGVDNDCDGQTDASDALDLVVDDQQPCELTSGVCMGVSKPAGLCVGGQWQPCTEATYSGALGAIYQAGGETKCDALDNDCDGQTDAADPDLAGATKPLCEKQSGVCAGSMKTVALCVGGAWGACTATQYQSHSADFEGTEELSCDGQDNDCDGTADDPFLYNGKAVGLTCDGVGACGAGVIQCRPDESGATCSTNSDGTASQAVAEGCNGVDDDCDGQTDEGLGLAASPCFKVGVCATGVVASCVQATWVCDYAAVVGYEAGEEVSCDGKDNDCDASTDEDFAFDGGSAGVLAKGDACTGSGGCDGVVVCNTNGDGLACSSAGGGGGEICDGVDNDCDGQTDEGLTWTDPGSGASIAVGQPCDPPGVCGPGDVECAGGVAVCSTAAGGSEDDSGAEVCNGADDDCDGQTDEGYDWSGLAPGSPCDTMGNCTVECTAGGTAAMCTSGSSPEPAEVCDGVDNDCDGQTDEGLTVGSSTCKLTGVCTVSNVGATCSGGQWQCDYSGVPGYATTEAGKCNGLDDDCDGATDEDFPTLGQACDGSDPDSCANGTVVCAPGGAGVVCDGDVASVETCNGVDDDCDGLTDEEDADGCSLYYVDNDNDTWGDPKDAKCLCAPTGAYDNQKPGDCNDDSNLISPSKIEGPVGSPTCTDGNDNDCDGDTDGADSACSCLDTCGGSCGGTGCCTEDCSDGSCVAETCPNNCDCALDCGGADCGLSCTSANQTCALLCSGSDSCEQLCDKGATCDVDCTGADACATTCSGQSTCTIDHTGGGGGSFICKGTSSCEVDCTNAAECTVVQCIQSAECLLDCSGVNGSCGFQACAGLTKSCPGGILVCNRECP